MRTSIKTLTIKVVSFIVFGCLSTGTFAQTNNRLPNSLDPHSHNRLPHSLDPHSHNRLPGTLDPHSHNRLPNDLDPHSHELVANDDNASVANPSTPVSIANMEVANLKMYPNPNNGLFRVSFTNSTASDIVVRITDAAGRELASDVQKSFSGDYSKVYDISREPEGIYLLTISSNGNSMLTKKLIKNPS